MFRFRIVNATLLAASLLISVIDVSAQTRTTGPMLYQRGTEAQIESRNASEMRQDFRDMMRHYPPSLSEVLRLDPTLLANEPFMAAYPDLVAYLKSRPEIRRDPMFYLGESALTAHETPRTPEQQRFDQMLGMWRDTSAGLFVFAIGVGFVLTLTWLVRYAIGHRRWLRATKLQSDFHGRLLERLASNEELLAYIQSPAGSRFLQAAPITAEPAAATLAAPLSRILWSAQVGLVAVCIGIGLLVVRHSVFEEVAQMLLILGSLAVSLGVGFALAAVASYALSSRLGLLSSGPARSDSAGV